MDYKRVLRLHFVNHLSGREIAEKMYQRHLVLAKFLMRLGVREETAFADACRMEHDISAETFSAIYRHAEKGWE